MTYVNLLGVNSKHKGTRSVFVHVWSIDASLLKKATEVGQNIPKLKDAKTVQQCWCKLTSGWEHLKLIAHETTDSLRFLGRGEGWWWWVTYDLWSLYDCEKLDILVHNALELFWGRASWPSTTEVTLWPHLCCHVMREKKIKPLFLYFLTCRICSDGLIRIWTKHLAAAPSCAEGV